MTLKSLTHTKTLTEEEINQIIREAALNPPSEFWEFSTDQDDLVFIQREIRKNGRIKIEKIP
jgi:hypothetical protein